MCAQHTADSATYTFRPENCLNTQIGREVPFRVSPKGESLAIVRLKVASLGTLLRPDLVRG
jgi:hypothetical protein